MVVTHRDGDRAVPPAHVPHGGSAPAAAPPPGPSATLSARLGAFFGVDDHWVRQGSVTRWDVLLGLMVLVFSTVALELIRSGGALRDIDRPGWAQWLAVALGAALLVGRRRWPLTVASLAALHMVVVGIAMPEVAVQIAMQVFYFVAIFSGVAWAQSRRDMLAVTGVVVVVMFVWIAWQFAVGSGIDDIRRSLELDGSETFGLVSPIAAWVLYTALVNAVYFGSAILGGQVAWRSARQRARLAEQAELLRVQADSLQRRAVLEERLRIARELHDVVAHHVSVIGIHAGAGRRVLGRDPAAAASAFGQIEQSSREAVSQMRGLLGTLRALDEAEAPAADDRSPEPGLADLPALVEGSRTAGLGTSFELVEDRPGAAERVPRPIALSLHRIGQEALANVRRHSTATRVDVVVRVQGGEAGGYAEIEVVDDGRARSGTSGTGLGQLGIRERAASHRGEVEIGPRPVGGYRVRVRLPLTLVGPLPAGASA
jgi:signal transduction histidine kinase